MRPDRIFLALALAGGLLAPRGAEAACELLGPYLGVGPQLPQTCPFYVFSRSEPLGPGVPTMPPEVTVLRNGQYVSIGRGLMQDIMMVPVDRTFLDCQQNVIRTDRTQEPLERFTMQLDNVAVGERVGYGRGWFGGIEIVAPGPCAAPILPMPACVEQPFCGGSPPFDDFEPNGCAARGGAGPAAGLVLLGLLALTPRRRRRRR
jgi:MYXO-CTERM domain-containing protein